MAPEPAILKRQRSRPSEWWAATPTAGPPDKPSSVYIAEEPSNRKGKNALDDGAKENALQPTKKTAKEVPTQLSKRGQPSTSIVELPSTGDIEPQLKEKRGRPSAGDSISRPTIVEAPVEAGIVKRSGRIPASQLAPTTNIAEQTAQEERRGEARAPNGAQRRGRSTNTQDELQAIGQPPVQILVVAKKAQHLSNLWRGSARRPVTADVVYPETSIRGGSSSNTEAEVQAIFDEATRVQQKGKEYKMAPTINKDARASTQRQATLARLDAANEHASIEVSATSLARPHTRRRRSNIVLGVETAVSTLAKDRKKTKKREGPVGSRARKTVAAVSLAVNLPKSKGQRKTDTKGTNGVAPREQSKRVKNVSNREYSPRKRKDAEDPKDPPQEKRCKIDEKLDKDSASRPKEVSEYQHLTAVIRQVSRQTIEAKWSTLPPGCIELISQILHDVQRPVIVRLNDERKRTQASTALQMVSRRLVSKISKGLPFPGARGTREDDFDFEKILDRNRALEAQLTPALQANELLEAELSREKILLESEHAALGELETNAKTQLARRKQAERKLHSLLQPDENDTNLKESIRIDSGHNPLASLDVEANEELLAIFDQISGHVESIQGNIGQVQGISEAIVSSKAAVQATLFDHLDSNQYEDVILG